MQTRKLEFHSWDLDPPRSSSIDSLSFKERWKLITEVMELGSQDFWCPQKNLVIRLCRAFGRDGVDQVLLNTTNASQQPARLLYEALGMKYAVSMWTAGLDRSSWTSISMRSRRSTKANTGWSPISGPQHILNQYNVFKAMHEFARPGSVFVHAVPFTIHLEHGFFNYQPNFFEAL